MSLFTYLRRFLPVTVLAAAITLCLLARPVTAAGTSGNNTTNTASAYIQVLNAATGASAVDVFIDGHKFVTQLSYARATPLVALPAGSHRFQIASCNAGAQKNTCRTLTTISGCTGGATSANGCLLDARQTLKANAFGTLAFSGGGKGSALRITYIPNPSMSGNNGGTANAGAGATGGAGNGNATIAFANLVQGGSSIDLAANGRGALAQSVKPGSYSKAFSLSANTYTFTLYPTPSGSGSSASTGDVLVLPNLGFIAGHTYLLFEYGSAASGHSTLSVGSTDVTPMSVIVLPTTR